MAHAFGDPRRLFMQSPAERFTLASMVHMSWYKNKKRLKAQVADGRRLRELDQYYRDLINHEITYQSTLDRVMAMLGRYRKMDHYVAGSDFEKRPMGMQRAYWKHLQDTEYLVPSQ